MSLFPLKKCPKISLFYISGTCRDINLLLLILGKRTMPRRLPCFFKSRELYFDVMLKVKHIFIVHSELMFLTNKKEYLTDGTIFQKQTPFYFLIQKAQLLIYLLKSNSTCDFKPFPFMQSKNFKDVSKEISVKRLLLEILSRKIL